MVDIPETHRTYDLKKPPGHKVAVPRWTLKFPDNVTHTYTLYVGLQTRSPAAATTAKDLERMIEELLNDHHNGKVGALDTFQVTEGFDLPGTRVWAAYFTSASAFKSKVEALDLPTLWRKIPESQGREDVGIWIEHFVTPLERLETNYARLEHKPGLAGIPGGEFPGHELTGYWGAGRDRIPASAQDKFEPLSDSQMNGKTNGGMPKGIGQCVKGGNWQNMCHIRSGQYWETCDESEREAYEQSLEPALMEGMRYLWSNPEETGTLGLRFLQNLDSKGEPMRETCGAGFHRNWADLEQWSSRHPSHLKIFNGAMRHAKEFGEGRKFMTWHEVSILKRGEARFEYINCSPETGVIRWVPLDVEDL